MYKHILINAVFNIFYSLVTLLRILNMCIYYGIFCSAAYMTLSGQYSKIVIVHFLGNALKLCSSVSYLFFAFSRFILVSDLKSKGCFQTFSKINLRAYVVSLCVLGLVLSSYKLFEYQINKFDHRKDFPFELRDEMYCSFETNRLTCVFFYAFKLVNMFTTDILCFCINVAIDLFLIKNFNADMKSKRQVATSDSTKCDIQKSKKNINRMVVSNGLLFLCSHVPEFVSSIILIVFARKILRFCFENLSCDLIDEEASVFNHISVAGQLFIYLSFNKNFKVSINDLLSRAKKRIMCMCGRVNSH